MSITISSRSIIEEISFLFVHTSSSILTLYLQLIISVIIYANYVKRHSCFFSIFFCLVWLMNMQLYFPISVVFLNLFFQNKFSSLSKNRSYWWPCECCTNICCHFLQQRCQLKASIVGFNNLITFYFICFCMDW